MQDFLHQKYVSNFNKNYAALASLEPLRLFWHQAWRTNATKIDMFFLDESISHVEGNVAMWKLVFLKKRMKFSIPGDFLSFLSRNVFQTDQLRSCLLVFFPNLNLTFFFDTLDVSTFFILNALSGQIQAFQVSSYPLSWLFPGGEKDQGMAPKCPKHSGLEHIVICQD